ncbi:hypothetical protein ABT336_01625 [Micromonospora sp. NPDC000207]|uniref:hypothetical protein n=1 Tax=Micromonospora sp. NPDC000207 TaxID=3154246 RepID=UPI0033304B83
MDSGNRTTQWEQTAPDVWSRTDEDGNTVRSTQNPEMSRQRATIELWHEITPASTVIERALTFATEARQQIETAIRRMASVQESLSSASDPGSIAEAFPIIGQELKEFSSDMVFSSQRLGLARNYLALTERRLRGPREHQEELLRAADATGRLATAPAITNSGAQTVIAEIRKVVDLMRGIQEAPGPGLFDLDLQNTKKEILGRFGSARGHLTAMHRALGVWQRSEPELPHQARRLESQTTWGEAISKINPDKLNDLRMIIDEEANHDHKPLDRLDAMSRSQGINTYRGVCKLLEDVGLRESTLYYKAVHALQQHLPHEGAGADRPGAPLSVNAAQLRLPGTAPGPASGATPKRPPSDHSSPDAKRPRALN